MKILINLSDSVYDAIKNKYTLVNPKEGTLIKTLWDAVENGTPLPKGHGRLIDESKIKKCGWHFIDHHAKTDAPTIIEADRSDT